jgi:iron complex outermembrane receptor protein
LDRRFSNLTWTIGYNLNREQFALKANLGKSFRMPLAKELAANGVNYHHFSYEVGNPELSPETAYQLDAGLECHTRMFAIGLSPFLSLFPDYIYLNPGYEHDRLYGSGNQVFTYTQSKVIRYGGEIHAHYQPFRSLRVGMIGEYIYSKQLSGEKTGFGLPFSPPASLLLHLKYKRDRFWHFPEPYAELDVRLVAGQQRIVPPEEPTPGYQVIHLRTGSKIRFGKHYLSVNIQVQNLLNRKYLDHTSYYRLINIPEPGRDLTVNISIPFPGHLRNPTSNEQ